MVLGALVSGVLQFRPKFAMRSACIMRVECAEPALTSIGVQHVGTRCSEEFCATRRITPMPALSHRCAQSLPGSALGRGSVTQMSARYDRPKMW